MRREKGGYIVFVAIMMAVLIGVGALALDLGRMFVLRSEMQNAADSAALAAASELRGDSQSISRATAAARFLLSHQSRFAEQPELLQSADISVTFYCHIGSSQDPDPSEACDPDNLDIDDDGRYRTSNPSLARYVRTSLDRIDGNDDAYAIQLYFLPVLDLSENNERTRRFLNATATAGRIRSSDTLYCNTTPMFLCNPYEPSDFADNLVKGDLLRITMNNNINTPSSGNFGWIETDGQVRNHFGNTNLSGCSAVDDQIDTSTGATVGQVTQGINIRFEDTQGWGNENQALTTNPPAPNIMEYTETTTPFISAGGVIEISPRSGANNWNPDGYWDVHHASSTITKPSDFNTWSRWEVYEWEINNGEIPAPPSYPPGPAERRELEVAVANCSKPEHIGNGSYPFSMDEDDGEGFARVFISQRAGNQQLYLEFIEWLGGGTSDDTLSQQNVRLYE